jgi:formylglycine-generating enzyme required for sulfatase activity
MRHQKLLLFALIISGLLSIKSFGQCAKVPGTIQISDSFAVKATEITVYDYTSFIVAKGYDTTLFPAANFLENAPYKELFTDLRNKTHDRFLKAKGKGSYTFYYENVKGNKAEKQKLKRWLELPMGGISSTQAELYCKWLESYYNQYVDRLNRPCFYELRLPSEPELATALLTKGVLTSTAISGQTTYRFIAFIHKR